MRPGRKLLFATVTVVALLALTEGAARIAEALTGAGPGGRAAADADLRIAFYGGSTVAGVPLPEIGFVEQFRVLFEARHPGVRLAIDNRGQAGIPAAGVAQRVAATLDGSVDLAVVMTGHNEFIRPRMTEVELHRAYALGRLLDHLAAARLARRIAERLARRDLPLFRLDSVSTPEPRVERRVEAFAANLDTIARVARSRGVPVVLSTLPANVTDWPPARPGGAFRHPPLLEGPLQQVRRALEAGDADQALRLTETLLRSHPVEPTLRYLRGRALRLAGRDDEAWADLLYARDHDPLPRRVLSSMNEAVRRRAAEGDGITLVDLDVLFDDRLRRESSAFSLFADNCHPTPRGGYLIASAVLEAVEALRPDLPPASTPVAAPETVLEQLGFGPSSELRLEYLARNARYCMKTPFFNYAAARSYLDEALRLAPGRWDLWANHASMSLLSGERERGIGELERALEANPQPVDPGDKTLTPYLEIALERAGLRLDGDRVVARSP